jgi:hypothetical protein
MQVAGALRGLEVLDAEGQWVGTVVDTWPDDGGGEAELVLVTLGRRFPKWTYLPTSGSVVHDRFMYTPITRLDMDDAPAADDRRWGDPARIAKAYWMRTLDD